MKLLAADIKALKLLAADKSLETQIKKCFMNNSASIPLAQGLEPCPTACSCCMKLLAADIRIATLPLALAS